MGDLLLRIQSKTAGHQMIVDASKRVVDSRGAARHCQITKVNVVQA